MSMKGVPLWSLYMSLSYIISEIGKKWRVSEFLNVGVDENVGISGLTP